MFTEQILIFQEGLFDRRTDHNVPGNVFSARRTDTNFPGAVFFGYRTDTDFPGSLFQIPSNR